MLLIATYRGSTASSTGGSGLGSSLSGSSSGGDDYAVFVGDLAPSVSDFILLARPCAPWFPSHSLAPVCPSPTPASLCPAVQLGQERQGRLRWHRPEQRSTLADETTPPPDHHHRVRLCAILKRRGLQAGPRRDGGRPPAGPADARAYGDPQERSVACAKRSRMHGRGPGKCGRESRRLEGGRGAQPRCYSRILDLGHPHFAVCRLTRWRDSQ